MISFVWTDPLPLYSGRGGTESFTVGQVRELQERGIPARILTYGHGKEDGRQYHPDVVFHDIQSLKDIEKLDDTIIYVNIPHDLKTKNPSYVFFHFPPLSLHATRAEYIKGVGTSTVIVNSRFLRNVWADYLDVSPNSIRVLYPFADPAFSKVKRVEFARDKTRVLFASRLHPEKGIYTLLEALHHKDLKEDFSFTVTTAGNETDDGKVIERLLRAHPSVQVVPARHTPASVASLFARYDIVVIPSNHFFWSEAFGMVSVEAQHAGCRVVASNSGGLPETDCGELQLYQAGNSLALAKSVRRAAIAGPLGASERKQTIKHFTRAESADLLLTIIKRRP